MAPRAVWKGHLEVGQLVCPVAMHAAASTSERVSLHVVNRKTGHRVGRVFVDVETGEPVERDDQAKGYETSRGRTVVLDADELAEAVPESDKTLRVEAFTAVDPRTKRYLSGKDDKPKVAMLRALTSLDLQASAPRKSSGEIYPTGASHQAKDEYAHAVRRRAA